MMSVSTDVEVGSVVVHTTKNRGFTPEEIAERCLDKIVSVADTALPEVRAQAHAFKDHIRAVLVFYMKEAANSDRTTVYNALVDAGQKDLAELIRRM
ncbi:MAG: hypothetical protein CMB36_04205 [Euryarchaeota archaeon]|nr:hypothetical protein [Euryarchaeota archaeon]